jgi:SAM-dependent methyltransferase
VTGTRERRRIDRGRVAQVDHRADDGASYGATLAADFLDAYRSGTDRWTDEEAIRRTTEILVDALGGDVRGRSVLDVGCGRGVDVAALVAQGARPVGIDIVPVDDWTGVVTRHPGARFVAGDLVELLARGELSRGGFDAVLDNGCLHHQHPDRMADYLAAVHEALVPDGLLVVSVFGAPEGSGAMMRNDAGRIFRDFGAEELDDWGRAAGFEPLAQHLVPREGGLAYRVAVWRSGREPR